jgi:Zonular occludens toxin (Zot)
VTPNELPPPVASARVFVAGNSGTGKTTMSERAILAQYHRQIIIDMTGEWRGKVDAEALTVPELQEAVRTLAREKSRWRVSISLDPDEFPELVAWLVPVPRIDLSPIRQLRGAVLLVDEVDLLAPQGTAAKPVRTLYRRSRHAGLSICSTTQRPENVSREVSAQSTHAACLYLSEPRGVEYMAKLMRWGKRQIAEWQAWVTKHRHGGEFRNLTTGQVWYWSQNPRALVPADRVRDQLALPLASDDDDARDE